MKTIKTFSLIAIFAAAILFTGCKNTPNKKMSEFKSKTEQYAVVKLTTDLSVLSEKERQMLPYLFKAADIMNELFWLQTYGDYTSLLDTINDDYLRKYVQINYGPWERLNDNNPFIQSFGEKPAGANFYPQDMTPEEFETLADTSKNSQYTILRRDESGQLIVIPYHRAYNEQLVKASGYIKQAAELAEDPGLKNYLELRSEALLTDEFYESDLAWMDMTANTIDIVIGPIENYEDALYGIKAAYESYILIKDKEWSLRLLKYVSYLPELQKGLPVDEKYKSENPGSASDLAAYDVIYYAGDCNAGSKTIAINLPNDENVQLLKGSRRIQLKNAMQAKFDKIMLPISGLLITKEQRNYVKFDAFFENVMFHEIAHGLGIKQTINGNGLVREALKETYSTIEEGKADILGLYMITKLSEQGVLTTDLMDNYVTFMTGIFRSIRFGAASAHGKANLIRYNYFKEKGAFVQNTDGTYSIDFKKMQLAMNDLSALILILQGDGNYTGTREIIQKMTIIDDELRKSLDLIAAQNIPVDIVFEQGPEILGLKP